MEKCICGSKLHETDDRVCSEAIVPTLRCTCWVALRSEAERFSLHYGAASTPLTAPMTPTQGGRVSK